MTAPRPADIRVRSILIPALPFQMPSDGPAAAHFTGCYLTADGRSLAETELAEHPDWANPDVQQSC